ncbi:hypothetical protein COCVIDRAFT_26366 [Bipolaris victoriae FI3]|uniref:Rhodanese domain-containing protein n=2 Tax=Bipolaris TaxID=33194 RepID=W6Y9T2_COCC2|nr:uncharacterized protein COCCADRAFT_37839 [Bipolaris zeicola 26-R-13]XP_014556931.1 hypothetical protein COCVIDRAFT_26366 [Bipolaris victoriae FI3]EUC32169.1 hypothetical protein COCCADRAFT_37839 [Bipolaris zeicola 26-R-13]
MAPQNLLIDVRTPSEFSTGYLTSDLSPTVNIEYQLISTLPAVYAEKGIQVAKDDRITLYCRSGRRSNLALQTLREMGFTNARDIGGLEEARRVLDREQVERQLEEGFGEGEGKVVREEKMGARGHERVKSFGVLVEGLRALEG